MRLKFFVYQAEEGTEGSTPAAAPAVSGEDVSGLKATIANLRQEVAGLNQQLKTFEGISPDEARAAMSRLGELESSNKTLTDRLHARDIDLAVSQVTGGALPQYSPLLSSNVRGLLQIDEKGNVVSTDGRSLDALSQEYRQKYPNMFAADSVPTGAGVTSSAAPAPAPGASVVDAPNGIIQGVDPDAILKGEVTINPV